MIDFKALHSQVTQLRREHKERPTAGTPPAIALLQSMLKQASEENEVAGLMTQLSIEFSLLGMNDEAEKVEREMIRRFPDDPLPWISLAGYLLHVKEDPQEAKSVIETGIGRAQAKGRFIRHAHHTRARVAKALKDYQLLEETLKFLVDFRPAPGREDVNYEDDFLKGIPAGAVDTQLAERYKQLSQRAK